MTLRPCLRSRIKLTIGKATIAGLVFVCTLWSQTPAPDLDALEKQADIEFNGRDCVAAERTYAEALRAAQQAGETHRTGLYYVRFGNCRTRRGDIPEALDAYHQAIAVAEATGDNELLAVSVHGASLQLLKLGRVDEALVFGNREYELAGKCGHPNHLARAMWLVSTLYQAAGRVREGLALMNRALVVSRGTSDSAMTGVLLSNISIAYLALGDIETAAHVEKELLAMPLAGLATMSTTFSAALTYNNLGEILLKGGHRAEARKSFEQAVAASTAPDDYRVHIDALLNLAKMQNETGQIAEADAGIRESLEIAGHVNFPELRTKIWQTRSEILLARGDFQGAEDAGVESLGIARRLESPERTFKALLALGAARAAAGKQADARFLFDEAVTIGEMLRAQSPGEVSDLSRAFANILPVYQASVQNLIDLHLPAEALQRAEQAKARVLMDIMLRGGVDEGKAMTAAEAAEQRRLRKLVVAGSAEGLVKFRQFRRTLYENHPELVIQSADFEAAGVDKMAALMPGTNTALLDYFLVPSGVALFVVRETGGEARVSTYLLPDPRHTLAAEARRYREHLAGRDLDYKSAAQHLFNRLLLPAMADLRGCTNWIVSPDGALWDIPFEALVDPAGRHVIETRAVTMAPSLTAALQIHDRRKPATTGGLRLLALGNPLPSSAPLPDAAREADEIGASYLAGHPHGSALVLTGASATTSAFLDKAPRARIIHMAAHAGLNDGDPLFSFVRLGDGETLTALAIMSLHLHADMVVLSACETALGSTGPGEGMIGMGWALSAAGASSSVLSLWKVDSAASREFMTSFYRSGPVSKSEALRQTGLQMLRSQAYRHPFYWAAFTLQGDGASSLFE